MKNKKAAVILLIVGIMLIISGSIVAARTEGGIKTAAYIAAAVGLILSVIAFIAALGSGKEQYTTAKYARKKHYITAPEEQLLQMLRRIEPERYEVVPQAPLVALVDKLTETAHRGELFRVIDFAFLDRRTYAPLLLVELNDSSHLKDDRKLRDAKVGEICAKAKLPLISFTLSEAKDFSVVKRRVKDNILKR